MIPSPIFYNPFSTIKSINFEGTCGNNGVVLKEKHQYIPNREELKKYLCEIKELMAKE